eukprot:Unigene3176_Nuclearia_a/m.9740 Unigene3176_Nuclearia_a/g.9740  ORF Unigene3176_Nuclearia_a/g.9740 Unigene3176_Nuclearia_a/m.9740 type:complete len:102 (-) Unigene3176_Nuclearia_a:96-401(-)
MNGSSSGEFVGTTWPKDETTWEKLKRKSVKDPFVPVGALLTLGILAVGLYHFNRGNDRASQRMMRYRVLAQGATVAAMALGVIGINFSKLAGGGARAGGAA